MSAEIQSTREVLAEFDRRMDLRAAAPGNDPKVSYLLAASALHVFDPTRLQPWLPLSKPANPYQELFDYTVPAVGWRHLRLRSLRPDVRRSALAWLWRLGERRVMRAVLEANLERTQTEVQVLFEKWIAGESIGFAGLSLDRLVALGQLYDWGLAEFGGLPDRAAFSTAIARRSSVAMFEHLVDDSFVGRDSELQILRDYVGVVSLSIWEKVRSFVGSESRPPLVIYGPGGVGKTALIGKFLLEHVNSPIAGSFPFVYLPFDSETLDVREPFTILVSAAGQLSVEIGDPDDVSGIDGRAAARFRDLVATYRENRAGLRQRARSRSRQRERLQELSAAEEELYQAFGDLLDEIAGVARWQQKTSKVPVLLVFDTFEEVYYRAREDLFGFWRMLEAVQKRFPLLRIVIAGRPQPRPFTVGHQKPIELSLDNLGQADGVRLLQSLGIEDRTAAQAIVRQIGGNPLSLRLAARVAQREGAKDGIRGLETRRRLIFNVAADVVHGQLYRRILDHIHDPDVRALAHPGMVLRRVTHGIIRDVLAPACGLGHIDDTRADVLFEELRREYALVSVEDDSSLRYRDEVRRPMLALLINDKPTEVEAIQRAAIDYYTESQEVADRAEEIYHRLMLGQPSEMIAQRWLRGVESHLGAAVEELPPTQQIWLAGHMSIELPPETVALADLETWERIVGRRAFESLRYSDNLGVLALLGERSERTDASPLFAIEARALLALERVGEAAGLLDRGVQNYPLLGNRGRFAELLWLRAQTAAQLGMRDEARVWLTRLAEVAEALTSPLTRVQALTEMLSFEADTPSSATKEALAATLAALSPTEIDTERALIRLALVRLGAGYPLTIRALAPAVAGDLVYLLRHLKVDIGALTSTLQQFGLDLDVHKGGDIIGAGVRHVLDRIASGDTAGALTTALPEILKLENASLAGAGLAGLDAYREPWELSATAEVTL